MAPAYKLTYFNIKGLAESIRFILAYGGIEFEDVRIEREDWADIKPTMPFGKLPLLEYNGKKINQSVSISRYLGRELNIAGRDNWEALEVDAIVDTFQDFRQKLALMHYEQDETVKAERTKVLLNETIPYFFERLDKVAGENKGYLALGRLTWADLFFIGGLDTINFFLKKDLIAEYPNLVQLRNRVLAIPAIQKWIDQRPATEY